MALLRILAPKSISKVYKLFYHTKHNYSITASLSNIHRSRTISDVFNVSGENQQAWHQFQTIETYSQTIFSEERENFIKDQAMDQFRKSSSLGEFVTLSESNAKKNLEVDLTSNVISDILQKVEKSSLDEMLLFNYLLRKWPASSTSKTDNFYKIWNALDQRSCQISENESIDNILLLADCWFHLRLNRVTKYNEKMINYLLHNKVKELTKSQFVQLMFYVNLERSLSSTLSAIAEKKFMEVIGDLSVEEIGIVALGFFKTKNGIHTLKLLQTMIFRLTESLSTVDDYTFCAIIKCFRKSSHVQWTSSLIQNFLTCCCKHVDRLGLISCMHLCLLGTYQQVFNKTIMKKALDKCAAEIHKMRLKDLAQLIFAAGLFNFRESTQFTECLIKELRRRMNSDEANQYPRSIITCLTSLSMFNIYEEDLLNEVFSSKFLDNLDQRNTFSGARDLYVLHCGLKIERPYYAGNLLDNDRLQKYHQELGSTHAHPNSFQLKLTNHILAMLYEIFGHKNNVHLMNFLKHYTLPDIYAPISRGSVPSHYTVPLPRELERLPRKNWTCFLIGGKNCYIYHTSEGTGSFRSKKAQLQQLRFNVIEIPWFEYWGKPWQKQRLYLERKIFV